VTLPPASAGPSGSVSDSAIHRMSGSPMQRYDDLDGTSLVAGYEIFPESIHVDFKDGSVYL
jgi:hypothetical protein